MLHRVTAEPHRSYMEQAFYKMQRPGVWRVFSYNNLIGIIMEPAVLPEVVKERIKDQMSVIHLAVLSIMMGKTHCIDFMSKHRKVSGENFGKVYMSKNYIIVESVSGKFFFYDKQPEELVGIKIKPRSD